MTELKKEKVFFLYRSQLSKGTQQRWQVGKGAPVLPSKTIMLYLNLHRTESVTFPPSFPAAPGRPWSPGGPGDPGCPLSPLGPVPPVGPCGQHETAIKYLIMLHPREDEVCRDNFSDPCLIHLDYIQTSQQAQQRIGEKPLTVNVPCLYLWSNHPSRSWWSCFSLETLERKTDITD